MKAIACEFDGIVFRSRLEARWAMMFNLLGWTYDYEPSIDLDGYIPDFAIRTEIERAPFARLPGSPLVLAEAKPIVMPEDYAAPIAKIARSGWEHAAVVLCPTPWEVVGFGYTWAIGMATERVERRDADPDGYKAWQPVGISHDNRLRLGGGRDIRDLWRRVGNKVQWLPPLKGA